MHVEKRLRPFYILIALLAGIWVVEWGLFGGRALLPSLAPYLRSPLMDRNVRYNDILNLLPRVNEFGHAGMLTQNDLGLPYPYPLPSVLAILPFTHHVLRTYLGFVVVAYLGVAGIFARNMWASTRSVKVQAVLWSVVFLCHPMLFLADRGNIEIVIWVLLAAGLGLLYTDSFYLAAAFLGFAASMKIYPGVLLLLFLKRGGWKPLLVAALVWVSTTAGVYWYVGPTLLQAVRDAQSGAQWMVNFQLGPLSQYDVLRLDHSIFALAKQLYFLFESHLFHVGAGSLWFASWIRPYGLLAGFAFVLLYVTRIYVLPFNNQVISLLLLALLLPFVSYDYTLVHVLFIFAVLFFTTLTPNGDSTALMRGGRGVWVAILLAIVLSPLTNLAYSIEAGQVKCVCLLVLLFLVLRDSAETQGVLRQGRSA